MSSFLPESLLDQSQASSVSVTQATVDVPVGDGDVALMQRVFGTAAARPQAIPETFLAYLQDWLQISRIQVPISQIQGFSQFTVQSASVIVANEATTATSYTDLATVGPTIKSLPRGRYVFIYGARVLNNGSFTSLFSIQVGSTAASDNDAGLGSGSGAFVSAARATTKDLSADSTDVTMKYKVDGSTGDFQYRWLHALKYANL